MRARAREQHVLTAAAIGTFLMLSGPVRGDLIGLDALRLFDPTLTGAGVPVAQPEGSLDAGAVSRFEVNPTAVNQPNSLFSYISGSGTVNGTPPTNAAGTESGHANTVAGYFYANAPSGIAPGVSHVYNYDATYFINNFIAPRTAIAAKIVNESFVDSNSSGQPIQDPAVDTAYDNYVSTYRTIFVSAVGNSGAPSSPATAYNQISVGASNSTATTSIGPTSDGRSKPDISAPADETSYAAPQVAGAATILYQAGARGDGGGTAAQATDDRTIKALLLNGATKPTGWTHTATTPLDTRYGAGIVNIFNADQQLRGGKQGFTTSTSTAALGTAHAPPTGIAANVATTSGWDLNTITSGTLSDAVNHYFFNLPAATAYTLTGTLTWDRQLNQSGINNLDLYLYNVATGLAVDLSNSSLDNVEHLYTAGLSAGQYDLEVLKHGGLVGSGVVSNSETYALAFNFAAVPEPTSLVFLVGIFGALTSRRRRKAE